MVNRYAVIADGVVTNVVRATAMFAAEQGWVAAPRAVQAGDNYDGEEFSSQPPAPAPEDGEPVPDLGFAQLLIGLVAEGWITEVEGDAWLTGTLPQPVLDVISALPQYQQFAARARASRPSLVRRDDPLVIALGAAQGKTPTELDAFFSAYATA